MIGFEAGGIHLARNGHYKLVKRTILRISLLKKFFQKSAAGKIGVDVLELNAKKRR